MIFANAFIGQSPVNKTRKATLNANSLSEQQSNNQLQQQLQTNQLPQPAAQQQQAPGGSPKSKTWKGRVARQLRRMQGAAVGGSGGQSPTSPGPDSGKCIGVPIELCPPVSFYI